jgi:hypothetical protein
MKVIRSCFLVIYICLAGTLKGIAYSFGQLNNVDEDNNNKEIYTNK